MIELSPLTVSVVGGALLPLSSPEECLQALHGRGNVFGRLDSTTGVGGRI